MATSTLAPTERNGVRMPQRGQCHTLWLALDAEPKSTDEQLVDLVGCRRQMVTIVRRMHAAYNANPVAAAPKKAAPKSKKTAATAK